MKRVGWLVGLLFALVLPLVAQAHSDGTAQLIGVDLGACQISAWTWPEPLVTNDPSHVTVLVVEKAPAGESGDILLNSEVEVVFTPQSGSTAAFSSPATHELADVKFFYETKADLEEAGTWDILIRVNDAATACTGEAGFSLSVAPGPAVSGVVIVVVVIVLAGAIAVAIRQIRQKQKAS